MRRTRVLAPACLLAIAFWLLLASGAHAQDPDFSKRPDILNGEYTLLRTDDLVVAQWNAANTQNYSVLHSLHTSNGSITSTQTLSQTLPPSAPAGSIATALGRMFNLPNDIIATVGADQGVPCPTCQPTPIALYLTVRDPATNQSTRIRVAEVQADEFSAGIYTANLVMADFTGDGYDDLAIAYSYYPYPFLPAFGLIANFVIVKASDPLDFSGGLTLGNPFTLQYSQPISLAPLRLGSQSTPYLLAGDLEARAVLMLNVNPKTLAVALQSKLDLSYLPLAEAQSVVTGNFAGDPDNQQAVALFTSQGLASLHALLISFPAPNYTPTLLQDLDTGLYNFKLGAAASGAVHPFGNDSDAFAFGAYTQPTLADSALADSPYRLFIYTVANGKLVQQASLALADGPYGLAFGRFDNRTAAGENDPNLQLAMLSGSPTATPYTYYPYVSIYNIGANGIGYTPTLSAGQPVSFTTEFVYDTRKIVPLYTNPGIALAAGDLQGRTLRLAAPTKLTIDSHISPRTILGMPPMHVDYVTPSCSDPSFPPPSCYSPQVVGVLARPSRNWAQFNTSLKQTEQSSTKSSTSYSFGVMTTTSASLSFGVPDLASVSAELKQTADATFQNSVDTAANAYSTFSFDSSTQTGFSDHLWYDSYRMNIWNYPVIGQYACPSGNPNCSAGQKQPMLVRFSGPDSLSRSDIDGNLLPWYQPVWEPGNLLSYPWTQEQLLDSLSRPAITNQSNVWFGDTSSSNASVNWAQGSGQEVSSGWNNQLSSSRDIAVNGNVSYGFFSAGASVGLDGSTNTTNAALQTSSTEASASTGFTVNRPPQGVADYTFAAQTYILGQVPMTGTIHSLPLTTTVQANGPLRLAFWANPAYSPLPATWWRQTYSVPDVAVGHPQRWTWTPPNEVHPDLFTFNSVVTNTAPYDQQFYYMRGLFVTDARSPGGPQLTTGTVTQPLLLQARIYNFSFADMPPATKVKVRFYAQVYEPNSGAYPAGGNFQIAETSVAPLPGFASTTTQGDPPNWRMAEATFNPADHPQTQNGNVYLRFWVVTWMEDANGNLVKEPENHGLKANPQTLTINGMGDIPVEGYSNNVGTLDQVYYLQSSAPAALAPLVPGPPAGTQSPTITVQAGLTTPPPQPATAGGPFGKHLLTATLRNGNAALQSVQVLVYDGDPAQQGRLVGWKLIPYVEAGSSFVSRVNYTPQQCGSHTMYIQARAQAQVFAATTQVDDIPCTQILPFVSKR